MRGPPDPEMRSPAAGNGRANRKTGFKKHEEKTTTTTDIQVRSLCHRFALAHYFAVTVAGLAFAVSR